MIFMRAGQSSTNALFQLVWRQGSVGLDDASFAMHPLGFNRVEPGALDRQRTNEDPCALTRFQTGLIMRSDPLLYSTADMPTSVVPHQNQDPLAPLRQLLTAPLQKLGGDGADRSTLDKAQPHFLGPLFRLLRTMPQQNAITRQCFGGIVFARGDLFDQPQWFSIRRPAMQMGLRVAAPPYFVLKADRPVGMLAGQADQSIAELFFRWYSGSGLVIHCLARFQRMPIRSKVARTVSSLTRSVVNPSAKLTSATNSSVHTLVSFPYWRGLLCRISFKRSACALAKAADIRCGRRDLASSAFKPCALNALITRRTVSSSQPRFCSMVVACCLRSLANRIWQRRMTNALPERNPASICSRSASVKVRTNSGAFMPPFIPYRHLSCRIMH